MDSDNGFVVRSIILLPEERSDEEWNASRVSAVHPQNRGSDYKYRLIHRINLFQGRYA
jgi:hypothetical protein